MAVAYQAPFAAPGDRFESPSALGLSELMVVGMLGVTVLAATGLSYFWVPYCPLWLATTMMGLAMCQAIPELNQRLSEVVRQLWWPIIIPWLCYVGVIFLRDAIDGSLDDSFTNRFGVNAACLLVFVFCAVVASGCTMRRVIIMLAILAMFQGIVAILQYAGSLPAWRLPETISAHSARDVALIQALAFGQSGTAYEMGFAVIGRARGLDVLVHKFSGHVGILGAFLATYAVLWSVFTRRTYSILFIGLASLLAVVGVVFSFSRAPIFGLGLAITGTILFAFRRGQLSPLFALFWFFVATTGVLVYLRVWESTQITRIFEMDLTGANDAARLESMRYSLQMFMSSPLLGMGSSAMEGAALVTHCVPLRILGDYGLLGFACYAAVWFGILRIFWQTARSRVVFAQILGVAAFSGTVVAILNNLTHSSGLLQRDTSEAALFGVIIGLCLNAHRVVSRQLSRPPPHMREQPPFRQWAPPPARVPGRQ